MRRPTPAPAALAAALGSAAVAVAACGSQPSGPPELQAAAGTYTLRTINGAQLPAPVPGGSASRSMEILGDEIVLSASGVCSEVLRTRLTERGTANTFTDAFNCRWALTGTSVTLTYSTGGVVTGTLADGALAITPDGRVWAFTR